MSSGDYVSQDSINLSTSSLFKGRGDFPSRRCLAEWLVKIRIRFLLLLLLLLLLPPPPLPLRIFPTAFLFFLRLFFFISLHLLFLFSSSSVLPPPFSSSSFPLFTRSPFLFLVLPLHVTGVFPAGCNGFLFPVYSRRRRFSPLASSKHPRFRRPPHPFEIDRFR